MFGIDAEWVSQFVVNYGAYGYVLIALFVGLESMGIPLPGETILVTASIFASMHPSLNIWLIALSAAIGAIVGDNAGYWIGARFGFPLLLRYGPRIGVPDARIKLGQYLFQHYGFLVVFFGRFVALLRILAAFLAGVNKMHWSTFFIANAAGGILWSLIFSFGGYHLGSLVLQMNHTLAFILVPAAVIGFFAVGYLIRRYEGQLMEKAERELPGPIR